MASSVALLACAPVAVTTQIGFAQLAIQGDLALATDNQAANGAPQDLGQGFGLGSARSSAFGRVELDFGVPVVSASGLWFREAGTGALAESFGGLPAGTEVKTNLDLGVWKVVAASDFQIGPVKLSPGVLVDVFRLDFQAATVAGDREEIDEIIAVPVPCLRVVASPIEWLELAIEGGYLDAKGLVDGDPRFWDLDTILALRLGRRASTFLGYRWLHADANAVSPTETVRVDVEVQGWFLGAGLTF